MKKSAVPKIFAPIVDAITPAAVGLAAVGTGAVVAQVGGAIAKAALPPVEAFAAKSVMHEAAVDMAAGTVADVGICAGVAMWKGVGAAAHAAPLLLIGTAVSSAAPAIAPKFAALADKAVGLLFPSRSTSPTPGGFVRGQALGGLLPGGVEQAIGSVIPGGGVSGDAFDESPTRFPGSL